MEGTHQLRLQREKVLLQLEEGEGGQRVRAAQCQEGATLHGSGEEGQKGGGRGQRGTDKVIVVSAKKLKYVEERREEGGEGRGEGGGRRGERGGRREERGERGGRREERGERREERGGRREEGGEGREEGGGRRGERGEIYVDIDLSRLCFYVGLWEHLSTFQSTKHFGAPRNLMPVAYWST